MRASQKTVILIAQKTGNIGSRIKCFKLRGLFTVRNIGDRDFKFITNTKDDAALARAVHFGEDHPIDGSAFMEQSCLIKGILPEH